MLTFDAYQKLAARTAEYPPGTGVMYTILGLAGESGELANKAKKLVRLGKDLQDLELEDQDLLLDELGDVLWYAAMLCGELGVPFMLPAIENLKKLKNRQSRGDIKSMEHGKGGQES